MAHKLFLVTTESSGDFLAGRMLRELKQMVPDLTLTGVGGDLCIAEGLQPLYQVRDFNVMGLFEVLSQLKRLKAMFKDLVAAVERDPPDVVVLVDAPDFNLRFARAVRRLGVPIVYYVSPQVWAWRKKRAAALAGLVDHIMLLFSFEQDIYEPLGLPWTWVGHPLVDELRDQQSREDFFSEQGLDPGKPLVALAPGSRTSIVAKLLPVMARIADQRADRYQFALPLAATIDRAQVEASLGSSRVAILPGGMRPLMAHADAAVVASGTGTLETGLLQTPMIVGYKLKFFSWLLAQWLVKTPHVAMVNIVLGRRVVPEMIQSEFEPGRVLPLLDELVAPGPRRSEILAEFAKLPKLLGGGGASRKAAAVVKRFLEQ